MPSPIKLILKQMTDFDVAKNLPLYERFPIEHLLPGERTHASTAESQ